MPTPMKTRVPSPECHQFMEELKAVIAKHPDLSAQEMLAGASHLVGSLVALQDQATVTPAMAMELVGANIEKGNAEAIGGLMQTEGES